VIAHDGTLRIVHGEHLSSVDLHGRVRWTASLADLLPPHGAAADREENDLVCADDLPGPNDEETPMDSEPSRMVPTLPAALQGGQTLVGVATGPIVIDAQGRLVAQASLGRIGYGGDSLNVTYAGAVVLPTYVGDGLHIWDAAGLRRVDGGGFGLDVVQPAIFADDSIGVSDYLADGFFRVRAAGGRVWTTALRLADGVPTVDHAQRSAVSAANEDRSILFSERGEPFGELGYAAEFAVYPDGGWIACGSETVARLDARGRELWRVSAVRPPGEAAGVIVDRRGTIHVRDGASLVALDSSGAALWSLRLGACDGPVFPVEPGRFGVVIAGALRFVG